MPTKKLEVYKCEVCGNIVEINHEAFGRLVCCNKPMVLQEENTVDAAQEKHVPVIEKMDGGYKVSVGSVEHPMADDHWIEWIELIVDGDSYTKFLNPGEKPVAEFKVEGNSVKARGYCNLHGLWMTEL